MSLIDLRCFDKLFNLFRTLCLFFKEGESYINSICSSRITCSNKGITRENYGCSNDATCVETNGVGVCNCNEWFQGNGVTCTRNGPRDCSDLQRAGRSSDMVYIIYPTGSSGFSVYCEMSDGGWTVSKVNKICH